VKKTAPNNITAANLEKMHRDGNVIFDETGGMTHEQCLLHFKGNLLECKVALSKIKVRDFRTTRNVN
jgi:hypothetical protein